MVGYQTDVEGYKFSFNNSRSFPPGKVKLKRIGVFSVKHGVGTFTPLDLLEIFFLF